MSEIRRYFIGIEYDSPWDDRGYFDIIRTVTMSDLAQEIIDMQHHGHSYPNFPPNSNPRVLFARVLSECTESDCYHELHEMIKRLKRRIGKHHDT